MTKAINGRFIDSYSSLHRWLRKNYQKTGVCENCLQKKKTEWSNKTGELIRPRSNWQELCHDCHVEYDMEHGFYDRCSSIYRSQQA